MPVMSDSYKRIISEVEERITNPDDLKFVKEKLSELSVMFMGVIDKLSNATDERIKQIENKQNEIETKIHEVEKYVSDFEANFEEIEELMEAEVDENEESFDFEIVCPYCNSEFITDINGKNEITCPECNNSIELDWDDEEEQNKTCNTSGCGCGNCSGCSIENNKNNIDQNKEDNDDDM